jgi:filamentous hemagglutinin
MFQWAGIPNSIQNITTIPGIVIRGNQLAIGQTAGKAAQAIANSGDPKKK